MTKETLITEITAAFSDVDYPGDEHIIRSANPLERAAVEYLKVSSRQGYSEEKLRYHHDDMGILTPEAFHYFLAAYLLAELEKENGIIGGYIVYWFSQPRMSGSPMKGMTAGEWMDERLALFSPRQRQALVEFLTFMGQADDMLLEDTREAIQNVMAYK